MIQSTVLPKRRSDTVIRIELPTHPAEHVAFACSPLLECVLSLHVLVGPKHHALQHDWVRRMRTLDPGLKRRIDAFAFLYRRHLPDFLVPSPLGPAESFEEEVAGIDRLGPELLLEELGRPLFDHGGRHGDGVYDDPAVREAMLRHAAADGEASRELAGLLLADPVEAGRRFAGLLADYWQAAFAAEWGRIEPLLAESVAEAGRLLASSGIWSVLGRLPPRCRADATRGELLIDLPHEHDVVVSETSPLVLSPSVYVWPHLRVNCDPPWPTALVYAAPFLAREAAPRVPPAELLRMLRALGDDTRLRILKLIAERPRTTQELGPLVGLSTAGLSKSLRRLAEAGLVAPRREGYYVVYSLDPARIAALSPAIEGFLEDAQGDSEPARR
jgi:DNA-binding transcriptional ArsR family regulator